MKRHIAAFLVCALAFAMLFACAKPAEAVTAAKVTPTPAPSASAQIEQAADKQTGLANPLVEVAGYAELLKAVPEVMLADAPDGATAVSYCYIQGDPVVAQIRFTLDDNEYTYRAAAADPNVQPDISGVYEDLSKTAKLKTEGNTTMGGTYSLRYATGQTKGLATWYYAPTGCQYSLYTPTGCDVSQAIEEVVDVLLPITADANGNPLAGVSNTPIPAVEEGALTGTVVDINDNNIVINTETGNTLQFMLSHVETLAVQAGDTVAITYSGNVLSAPEVVAITVLQSAPAKPQIHGSIMRHTSGSVFIETTANSVYGFVIDSATRFTGQSATLKTGNTVTLTYSGDLSGTPVATEVETTAVTRAPEPTPKPKDEDPVNKSLKGDVSSLTSKRVTINTDSGHTYTFQYGGGTVITGDYTLEVGSRIRVLYDGYASKGPLAKKIEVLSPPDPTPPSPVRHTISGTVTMQAGNGLVVFADSGREYSFLLGGPTIVGSGGVGDRVNVTFTDDGYGTYNVTRLEYVTPVVYDPGPLLDSPENDAIVSAG